jgi:IclR family transcriptional regulator, pca regulon regulatory protein
MAGRGSGPDFVEALARGLDILASFSARRRAMSLSEVAAATGLTRPTARRLLLTLAELGYVRAAAGSYQLTPKVISLGTAYVSALGLWDIARPHLEALVAHTGESSSMAQLDGSDIVYVARVSVPKLITLRVEIGTLFPAAQTSQGKVLLAALSPDQVVEVLALPSRSGLPPYAGRSPGQLRDELTDVRARGWALADEELAPGIRSVAVPVRDGHGAVRAAMNVTVHAAETSTERLLGDYLPRLLTTAGQVSAEWALWESRPHVEVARAAETGAATARSPGAWVGSAGRHDRLWSPRQALHWHGRALTPQELTPAEIPDVRSRACPSRVPQRSKRHQSTRR